LEGGAALTPQPLKPRVLIVDDNPANRTAFSSLLEDRYTVSLAESGAQALELSMKDEFAVILLDVRMPSMDGYETAELLRRRERTRYTPIIFMSAFDQSTTKIMKGYVAGATDFLLSPVDQELLLFKVAAFAQLYLRNEALKSQIQQLGNLIQALQVEAAMRSGPPDASFRNKINQLEEMLEDLQRQVTPAMH
jgi:CheY-like chemotaxis protein